MYGPGLWWPAGHNSSPAAAGQTRRRGQQVCQHMRTLPSVNQTAVAMLPEPTQLCKSNAEQLHLLVSSFTIGVESKTHPCQVTWCHPDFRPEDSAMVNVVCVAYRGDSYPSCSSAKLICTSSGTQVHLQGWHMPTDEALGHSEPSRHVTAGWAQAVGRNTVPVQHHSTTPRVAQHQAVQPLPCHRAHDNAAAAAAALHLPPLVVDEACGTGSSPVPPH
jgi:hypothetical protein